MSVAGGAAALAAAGLLAGCNSASSGGTAPSGGLFGASRGAVQTATADQQAETIRQYLEQGYCPPIQIRPGTEALAVYDKGHDQDQNFVRYQASITNTARECHGSGTTLTMKVGISGRLAAGPKGAAGNFVLPLRVAVIKQHGGNVFYSQITKVPVALTAPAFATDFSTVVDNITVTVGADDRDLIIYIGYDEGKPKAATPTG